MLGAKSIRSFDEDNTRARLCDVFYDHVKWYCLTKFDWSCARAFAILKENINVEVPEGLHAYALPANCAAVRDLAPRGSRDKWEVIGTSLFCFKVSEVGIYYTRKDVAESQFTAPLTNLISLGLAVRLAPTVAKDKAITDALFKQYKVQLSDDWETDANIGTFYPEPDNNPNLDTFVNPDLGDLLNAEMSSRWLSTD